MDNQVVGLEETVALSEEIVDGEDMTDEQTDRLRKSYSAFADTYLNCSIATFLVRINPLRHEASNLKLMFNAISSHYNLMEANVLALLSGGAVNKVDKDLTEHMREVLADRQMYFEQYRDYRAVREAIAFRYKLMCILFDGGIEITDILHGISETDEAEYKEYWEKVNAEKSKEK